MPCINLIDINKNKQKIEKLQNHNICLFQYEPFSENLHVYLSLQQYIACTNDKRQLTIAAENECRRLHCSLKDLSSLLQALGRMAEHFIGENFPQRLSDGSMLLEK